ncbi:MAG: hypothetical protein ABSD74_20220 [Rhizomicrobium sp.]|jgi:hypothetical protein
MISPGAAVVSIAMILHPVHAPVTFQVATATSSQHATMVLARNSGASFGGSTIMQVGPNAGPSTTLPPIMKVDPVGAGPSTGEKPIMKVEPQVGPSTALPPIMKVDPPQAGPSTGAQPIMKVDPRPPASPSSGERPIMKTSPNSTDSLGPLRSTVI